jgi:1-acyl-sn-glycerol-3-phosphate acyltransferase
MSGLRSVIFAVIAGVITAIAATLTTLLMWAPSAWGIGVIRVWRRLFMAAVEHVLGIRYTVTGRENLPAEPVVILSKHQSAWETVALQDVFFPRWLCFIYKHELHWVPFVGWALYSLPMVAVNRAGGKDALNSVVAEGRKRLGEGHHVLVFPEGTRVAPGKTKRYKIGGAHLAVSTGARVVPVCHNAGELWPRNAFIKHAGQLTISIGPPIETTGLTADEVNARAEAWIEAEARRISPRYYAQPEGNAAGSA